MILLNHQLKLEEISVALVRQGCLIGTQAGVKMNLAVNNDR